MSTIELVDDRADERDLALVTERMALLDAQDGPRVGDYVRFPDEPGERRFSHRWEGGLQTSQSGSFHLTESGHVSFSGALDPAVPFDQLVDTGERKPGSVWIFHHDIWRAHNGVTFQPLFRVFECKLPRREAEDLATERARAAHEAAEEHRRQNPPPPVTPDALVERFCGHLAAGLRSSTHGWQQEDGHEVARGHCGYMGGRGEPMVVGFDEGYEWMGYLTERGWGSLPEKGDWPYVVYLHWSAGDGQHAIAEYCEADLTVWRFPSREAAKKFYAGLKDAP